MGEEKSNTLYTKIILLCFESISNLDAINKESFYLVDNDIHVHYLEMPLNTFLLTLLPLFKIPFSARLQTELTMNVIKPT